MNCKNGRIIYLHLNLQSNSWVNHNNEYKPLFLNYNFDQVVPADLIEANEQVRNETIGQFCVRLKIVWDLAREKTKQAM